MTFQGIAPIKPRRKNQKILHIKLRLSKVVEYFENTLKAPLQIVLLNLQEMSKIVYFI